MGHGEGVLQSVEPSAGMELPRAAAGALTAIGSRLRNACVAAALPGLLASASSRLRPSN